MSKILLVYEDYAELMSVESVLKKAGFDVLGLTNEYTVPEQVLAFNPDLVVGSGKGGKVTSLGVGKRLKEMHRWQGKSILIFSSQFRPDPQELIRIRVDMMLEAPVPGLRLAQVIGKVLNLDESALAERLNKSAADSTSTKASSSATSVSGKFSIEAEAIYVKGRSEEGSSEVDDKSLAPEKISDTETVPFAIDQNPSEDKTRFQFKFGDKLSKAHLEPSGSVAEDKKNTLFADVDLKALEKELLGGGVPEVERIDLDEVFEPEPEPEPEPALPPSVLSESKSSANSQEEIQKKARAQLVNAEKNIKNRVAHYAAQVSDVKVSPKSTVTRVEARRRQKQLSVGWDKENLKELDKLRREFTKALFKK